MTVRKPTDSAPVRSNSMDRLDSVLDLLQDASADGITAAVAKVQVDGKVDLYSKSCSAFALTGRYVMGEVEFEPTHL
jgi:hypothetical protein